MMGAVGLWGGTKSLGGKEGWGPSACGGKRELVLHHRREDDDTGGSVMEDEDSASQGGLRGGCVRKEQTAEIIVLEKPSLTI